MSNTTQFKIHFCNFGLFTCFQSDIPDVVLTQLVLMMGTGVLETCRELE